MGSRYAREDKKKGIFGYKRFLFPLIKPVCSSFMSSSVPHEIAAHEEAVPVPFRHTVDQTCFEEDNRGLCPRWFYSKLNRNKPNKTDR